MRKVFNLCNLYIALCCAYFLQGFLYSRESGISKYLVLIILLISLFVTAKAMREYKLPGYFKGVMPLLLMFFFYWVLLLLDNETYFVRHSGIRVDKLSFYKTILLSWLPIYAGYYFTAKGQLTEKAMKVWGIIFFVVATLLYFQNQKELLLNALSRGSSQDQFTNNMGYLFVALLPSLVLFKDKMIIQYAGLIYCLVFIMLGVKRGAILIGSITMLFYLWDSFRYSDNRKKYSIILLSIVLFAFTVYLFNDLLKNDKLFSQRLLQTMAGKTSGRDRIASDIIHYLLHDASLLNLFVGAGVHTTLKVTVNFAHNDWLEIMCCQGFLGIAIYVYYWFNFYRYSNSVSRDNPAFLAIRLMFIIYFLKTLFSMSYSDMTFLATIPFGYFLCRSQEDNLEDVEDNES